MKVVSKAARRNAGEKKRAAPAAASPRPWAWVAGVAVLVPLLAIGLYSKLGSPDAAKLAAAGTAENPAFSDKQILAMVDSLAEKMKNNPNDAQGWALLARSQNALGRWADAAAAFERANQLSSNNAQLLADYADVAAMAQGGSLEGKPFDLVQQALKADAENKKALALAGTAELNRRNFPAALAYWTRLQKLLPPGSEDNKEVGAAMEEIRLAMGNDDGRASGSTRGASTNIDSGAPAALVPAGNRKSATNAVGVAGKVTISPDLAKQVSLTDTLFIFARAANWQEGGPRMPLAVLRVQAKELPREFELTDGMAMAPNVKISDFPEVVIEARVSKSGGAVAQPGDLQGQSATVKPGAKGVTLVIDRVVK